MIAIVTPITDKTVANTFFRAAFLYLLKRPDFLIREMACQREQLLSKSPANQPVDRGEKTRIELAGSWIRGDDLTNRFNLASIIAAV